MIKGSLVSRFTVAFSDGLNDLFHLCRSFDVTIPSLDRHGTEMVDPDGQQADDTPGNVAIDLGKKRLVESGGVIENRGHILSSIALADAFQGTLQGLQQWWSRFAPHKVGRPSLRGRREFRRSASLHSDPDARRSALC